jgi:Cft2 family RNA processing exonuclease
MLHVRDDGDVDNSRTDQQVGLTVRQPHDDPALRVILAIAAVLKTWQRLPARDPRLSAAQWLKPSWPNPLLLSAPHRGHLVEQLGADPQLRDEVRQRLRIPLEHTAALAQARGSRSLQDVLSDSDDPKAMLAAAAVHGDPAWADAAKPFLLLQVPVPRASAFVAPAPMPTSSPAPVQVDREAARRERTDANTRRKELAASQREAREATRRAETAEQLLAQAQAEQARLRAELPSAKERKAYVRASQVASDLEKSRTQLTQLHRKHDKALQASKVELDELRGRLADAEKRAEAEATARHKFEQGLGDTAHRARTLADLIRREATSLEGQMEQRPGPSRTKAQRRLDGLLALAVELDRLYGAAGPADDRQPEVPASASEHRAPVTTRERALSVTAVGGANSIGGSALLVEAGDTRILIDAGVMPSAPVDRPATEGLVAALDQPVSAVIVTHAHADHAGYVPKVIEQHRGAKVYCSPGTEALLPTVWHDAVRVMTAEAEAKSGDGHNVRPAFGDSEVEQAEQAIRSMPCGRGFDVGDLHLTLFPAGHILGAAGVVVQAGEHRVVVTGDIDNRVQRSVQAAKLPPRLAVHPDLLVIETTYCDAVHKDRAAESAALVQRATQVLDRGGRVLIPAFGLGRAQEVALLLGSELPDITILIDGLARDISEIYAVQGAPVVFQGRVRKVENRKRDIRGMTTGVIITTSGMLTGGAAVPWASAVLTESESALFLCGHQDEEAPGRELLRLVDADPARPGQVTLLDDHRRPTVVNVAAAVETYNLSAHADRSGLVEIIEEVQPRSLMLVHGEPRPQRAFSDRLARNGWHVVDNQLIWTAGQAIADTRSGRRRHPARHPVRTTGGGGR